MTVLVESTSGIDQLNSLLSYIDVFYDASQEESSVVSGLHYLLDTSGVVPSMMEPVSDTFKFLKALSYAFYDVDEIISNLAELMDIDKCPPEFLEYLGNLVGWTLIGGDIASWRAQLRQAVYLYKQKGTKQSLINALSYVFPHTYTTFDPETSVKDCYESYFPFLLYYILKTESELCQDKATLISFLQNGQRTSDIVYNIDSNNHDNNIRFAVDAILEELDNKFKFISINGLHYKETPFYQNLLEGNTGWTKKGVRVTGKGYEHRNGFVLAIPPWERDRFYATSFITLEILNELFKILTGCDEGRNYGVSEEAATALIDYIKEKTGIGTTEEQFYFGYNNTFKFFTSSMEIPFNKGDIIASGTSDKLSVLDYWNSKSSHIFVVLETSAMDSSVYGINALTPERISNISVTMGEFLPFHALGRIVLKLNIEDSYYGYVESVKYTLLKYLSESNTTVLASHVLSGWLGTSGLGNYFSSLDTKYTKQFGRYLMKPDTSFWSVFSGSVERKATRRRNLRYLIEGEGFALNGKNLATPLYFYGSSLSSLEVTKEFIPLGFNFSGQHYIPPSSYLSAVYDTSNSPIVENNIRIVNSPSAVFLGSPVSSVMLFLGVDENVEGDIFVSRPILRYGSFYKAIVDYLIRVGQEDNYFLNFNTNFIEDTKFGQLHTLWSDYRTVYTYRLDGADFHALNHAFGPMFFNADFTLSGIAGNLETSGQKAYKNESILLDSPEYGYIYGSNGISNGQAYKTHDNQLAQINRKGLVWRNGWGSYKSNLDSYEFGNEPIYTNRTQLSGIEVVAKENTSTVIVADMSSIPLVGCHSVQYPDISGITFFGGKDILTDEQQLKIRLPLIRNGFLNKNPRFFNVPTNEELLQNSQTSSVANWKLIGNPTVFRMSGISSIEDKNLDDYYRSIRFVDSTVNFSSLDGQRIVSDPIKYLIPGDTYEISSAGYAPNASGALGYFLYNNEANKYYDFYNSIWVSNTSGSYRASAIDGGASDWVNIYLSGIKIDPTFDINNSYNIGVGISASGSTKSAFLREVQIRKQNENTLLPNREFKFTAKLHSQSYSSMSGKTNNRFRVRVYTGFRAYKCNSNLVDRFIFDFKRNRWMLMKPNQYNATYLEIELPDGETEMSFNIHTLNEYGPLDTKTRKLLTEPRYLNTHSLHTTYYFEIQPILPYWEVSNDLYRPSVRIENVHLRDLTYDEVHTNYIRQEAKTLLNIFSDLKSDYSSKDQTISEAFGFGQDGGSREVYLDQIGGSVINADSGGITTYNL